jgi:ABC-type transport system substrate-binding protein
MNNYLLYILLFFVSFIFSCKPKTEKKEYKVFKYNQVDGLSSLDPAFARNQANIWATNQLFNGLVELDDNMLVKPAIAKSWEISGGGEVYTFYLRNDVYFHEDECFPAEKNNRRKVNAYDFEYSFKRILNPQTASTGAWIFSDKVLRNSDGTISDTCFKAINDYTFRIYLDNPFPAFLEILAMPYAYVVPKEVVEKYGKEFRTHPIGTGPFKFKLWKENSALVLLKNENYFRTDSAGNRLPYLDAVQVSFINDKHMALLNFKQGKLDYIAGIDENSRDVILTRDGELKPEFAEKFKVEKTPYLNTEYLGLNIDDTLTVNKNHPILDVRFRKALNYAIDKNKMITYVRNNLGIAANAGFVPNCLPSFDSSKVKGFSYNPDLAAQLLAEAGYPNGKGLPKITLYTNATYKEMSEFLQKQWDEIGVKVEIEVNQFATHQELVDNSRINFFRGSWLGDYPDAENYLAVFYSPNFSPSGPNKTHFKNEKFDSLYELAINETNTKKRWELYNEMDKIIVENAPVVILYYDEILRITQKNIKGLKINPMNMLRLENVVKE